MLAAVVFFTACSPEGGNSKSKPKPSAAAAGSAADAHCIQVRSEYNWLKSHRDLCCPQPGTARTLYDHELAELMNHNWACFR